MSTPNPEDQHPDRSWPLPPDPFLRGMGMRGWVPESVWGQAQRPVPETGQDAALTTDDVLHCREQAVYAAALMVEGGQFPEDDAEKVVTIALRFENYIRTGQ